MPDRMHYGRTPDSICLLAGLALAGAALTIAQQVPASVAALAPHWVALVWSATFTLGAAVALTGLLWRDPLTGWVLELSGRIALACTAVGYAIALLSVASRWGTALIVMIVASIGVASGWRVYQLLRRLENFRAALREQQERGDQ